MLNKNDYYKNNKIKTLRIPYYKYDDIGSIIKLIELSSKEGDA